MDWSRGFFVNLRAASINWARWLCVDVRAETEDFIGRSIGQAYFVCVCVCVRVYVCVSAVLCMCVWVLCCAQHAHVACVPACMGRRSKKYSKHESIVYQKKGTKTIIFKKKGTKPGKSTKKTDSVNKDIYWTQPDRTGPDRTWPRTGSDRTGPNRTEPNRAGDTERNETERNPTHPRNEHKQHSPWREWNNAIRCVYLWWAIDDPWLNQLH